MDLDQLDARLPDWRDLAPTQPCTGLLLGNGASRAIWRNFAYDSLFERAQKVRNKPLGQTDLALFRSLATQSFEQVLTSLKSTVRVNAALAISSTSPLNRYYAIKEALIHAMRSVHIPFQQVPVNTLAVINRELRRYPTVYSSNYDLLCHWAVQHEPGGFADLFNGDDGFDLRALPGAGHRVLYLHGALHLLKNADASSRQRLATGSALLDGFAVNQPGDVPLFVSEGASEDKLRSIRSNDYLNWCHGQLASHVGGLCILGHKLNAEDAHLIDALRRAAPTWLAIGIFPLSDAWVVSQKRHYATLFEGLPMSFFDATSHGLCRPELNVPVPAVVGRKRR
ncbi:DUF4917 family protein [Pseudomonas sp. HR96]|uniref:DUF4917 family protein n=1 Tax=Pseudomonas sp. HR96 TaxID=1027966 RepID=UPI002A7661B5|nr:DUF4917 family protein [Pseudomonas sp. HR96]WPO99091.1 DUF4917 family protein [Pseudomonas sp. HR96]